MSTKLPNRQSIRLKGYDYSQSGNYFITICTQNRLHLFGEIINGEMQLNEAGKMVTHWYYELENKYNNVKCHTMVVMPNHFHCIIELTDGEFKDSPNIGEQKSECMGEPACSPVYSPQSNSPSNSPKRPTIGDIMKWFKTMTTNYYIFGVKQNNWKPFYKKLWQRNYWEHIIRNNNDYERINQYIINNPQNWENDKLH